MSQTYSYVREQCIQGVIRAAAVNPRSNLIPVPLDRIRAIFDASFFSVNSAVANVFASKQDSREMLRVVNTVTFASGDAVLPDNVLEKFIPDGTLFITGSPTPRYSFRRYPDWLRGGDPRLGLWTVIGTTMKAKTPQPVSAYSGSATYTAICSPAMPATENASFNAPDDFVSDFIEAMTEFIRGQITEVAATTA